LFRAFLRRLRAALGLRRRAAPRPTPYRPSLEALEDILPPGTLFSVASAVGTVGLAAAANVADTSVAPPPTPIQISYSSQTAEDPPPEQRSQTAPKAEDQLEQPEQAEEAPRKAEDSGDRTDRP
jgi:hypothetical protein